MVMLNCLAPILHLPLQEDPMAFVLFVAKKGLVQQQRQRRLSRLLRPADAAERCPGSPGPLGTDGVPLDSTGRIDDVAIWYQ